MHYNIDKNHTILCRHVEHKCCYEAKTNGQLLRELLAVSSRRPYRLRSRILVSVSFIVPILSDIDSGSVGRYN